MSAQLLFSTTNVVRLATSRSECALGETEAHPAARPDTTISAAHDNCRLTLIVLPLPPTIYSNRRRDISAAANAVSASNGRTTGARSVPQECVSGPVSQCPGLTLVHQQFELRDMWPVSS